MLLIARLSIFIIWFMPFVFVYSLFSGIEKLINKESAKYDKLIASISFFLIVISIYSIVYWDANYNI